MVLMKVELLYTDDCPGWQAMADYLDQPASELHFSWTPVLIDTWEEAKYRRVHGSPSLHTDGLNPFAARDADRARLPVLPITAAADRTETRCVWSSSGPPIPTG
jgi:hypothetical protein